MSEEQRRDRIRRALGVSRRRKKSPEEFGPGSLETAADLVAEEEAVDYSMDGLPLRGRRTMAHQPWPGPGEPSEPHVRAPEDLRASADGCAP